MTTVASADVRPVVVGRDRKTVALAWFGTTALSWFGFAHYFGSVPEGALGVIQSGTLALLLGSAMVTTRGLGWPWIIHLRWGRHRDHR